jgi:hypothetical protein
MNLKTKHVPEDRIIEIIDDKNIIIAKVSDRLPDTARVLAAAPQLLKSLETLVNRIEYYTALPKDQRPSIEDWEYTEGSSDMEEARKAIQSAKNKM